jgi:hypothetical protein
MWGCTHLMIQLTIDEHYRLDHVPCFSVFLIVIGYGRWQTIAGEPLWLAGGKSEHHTAACRVKNAGAAVSKRFRVCGDGKCHRKETASSLKEVQARVKRRGKSSPLAK